MKRFFKVVNIILIVLLVPVVFMGYQSESPVWVYCIFIGSIILISFRMLEVFISNKYKTRLLIVMNEFVTLGVLIVSLYLYNTLPKDIHAVSIDKLAEYSTITLRLRIIFLVNGLLEAFFHAKWFERKIDEDEIGL